jgi:hypothetical protein
MDSPTYSPYKKCLWSNCNEDGKNLFVVGMGGVSPYVFNSCKTHLKDYNLGIYQLLPKFNFYDGVCCFKPESYSPVVFEYQHGLEVEHFSACPKCVSPFIKNKNYKIIYDGPLAKMILEAMGKKVTNTKIDLIPKTSEWPIEKIPLKPVIHLPDQWKFDIHQIATNETQGGKSSLFHLIYTYGPQTRHFCVLAESEDEAKEKIIKQEEVNFGRDFAEDIRKTKANRIKSDVLQIYARNR